MCCKDRVLGWILAALSVFGVVPSAGACAFHGYTPNPTLVDVLLATEQAMVAQLSPSDPNTIVPVETLLGPDAPELSFPAQAALRARLEAHPEDRVLIVRDGLYGPWIAVAYLDGPFRKLVDQIIAKQSEWGRGGDSARVKMFAKRLNDPNSDIRKLALQELDRAPYGALRVARLPRVGGLEAAVKDDLTPIRILLLGLSKDRGHSAFVARELQAALKSDVPYAGAYATALMELEGAAAVLQIARQLGEDNTLTQAAQTRLIEAMAIQYASGPRGLRRVIAGEIAQLAHRKPRLRADILSRFGEAPWARK